MCIKETLRLYPLTIMVGKLSSEDIVTDGYKVPKGMYVCSYITSFIACRGHDKIPVGCILRMSSYHRGVVIYVTVPVKLTTLP